MDEKAVRAALSKFNFFEPDHSKVVCFTDTASTNYQSNGTNIRKKEF